MTRDEIIKLAREAKVFIPRGLQEAVAIQELQRFAALVAAAEREACAQVCDDNADCCHPGSVLHSVLGANAAAIRARGKA